MGTVKYSGPVASFHCPTNAEIRSLKVHFSPKQEGSGDPSPENVREIVGWDGVEVSCGGTNLINGQVLAAKIASKGGTIDTVNKTVAYSGSIANNVGTFFDKFSPLTQYTIIAKYTSNASTPNVNMKLYYSDGSSLLLNNTQAIEQVQDTYRYVTSSNKTITRIACEWLSATATLYYEDFGIFKGNVTLSEFKRFNGIVTNYEFGVLGKNKFNKNNIYEGYIKYENGEIEQVNWYNYSDYIPIYGNTLYLWNTNNSNSVLRGTCFYNNSKEFISAVQQNTDDTAPISISIPSGAAYVRVNIAPSKLDEAMITIDEAPTSYEPYNPNHTVYGGYVDLVSGEVWETWRLKDLGTVNWTSYSNRAGVFYTAAMKEFSATSKLGVLCNKYASTHDNVTAQTDKTISDAFQLRARSFAIYDTDYADATVAEFKAVMSGVFAAYPLAEPALLTTLTPTQLKTLRGTNNLWSNTNGNIELAYWSH